MSHSVSGGLVGDRAEHLLGVLHRGGDRVGHRADVPGDLVVDLRREDVGQGVDQLRGDLGGGVGVGEQAHDLGAPSGAPRSRLLSLFEVCHRSSSPAHRRTLLV